MGHRMKKHKCFGYPKLDVDQRKKSYFKGENRYGCADANDTCLYWVSSPTSQNFTLKCECGMSPHGKSYCPKKFAKNYGRNLNKVISIFG